MPVKAWHAAWIQSFLLQYTGQCQQLPVTSICLETSSASPKVTAAKKQELHFFSLGKFWSKSANGQMNQKPNTNVSVHIFFDCKTKWAFVCMPLLPNTTCSGMLSLCHTFQLWGWAPGSSCVLLFYCRHGWCQCGLAFMFLACVDTPSLTSVMSVFGGKPELVKKDFSWEW